MGDTVNLASRMESTSLPGKIQVTYAVYERTYDKFDFDERLVEVNWKGNVQSYVRKGPKHN